MALKLDSHYANRFDPVSTEYPQGKWRNRSDSTANDGGYLEQDWLNDEYGFRGALLVNGGVTPDGTIDTAQRSQVYEALINVINANQQDTSGFLLKTSLSGSTGQRTDTAMTQKAVSDALNGKQDELEFVGAGPEVMKRKAYGIGGSTVNFNMDNSTTLLNSLESSGTGFYKNIYPLQEAGGTHAYAPLIFINGDSTRTNAMLWFDIAGGQRVWASLRHPLKTTQTFYLLDSLRTTVDSNGFIKNASPIINLYNDRIETNEQFSEEPIFERLGVGIYKISNTLGLAKGEAVGDWYIETPVDRNKQTYFNIEWEQDEDNTIIVRTYRKDEFYEEYERYDDERNILTDRNGKPLKFLRKHKINGDMIDIVENRFITLRFHEESVNELKK